ncbi:hypothetical protein LFX15_18280 [Leptospira levettii]|uniref:hypothetical protein n=1 Tax=Leptospira levettii TaxID=2023178 RepID=UPI001EEB395D|nr:hypothetical protein [Leptospira levettii]MCG6150251.1 hypothetical protein [Leptospira levettii]
MLRTYYQKEMVPEECVGYSLSPKKPKLLLYLVQELGYEDHFPIFANWKPFEIEDFLIAHTESYVKSFFKGEGPLASSNGFEWNLSLASSVCFTNASLYHAIRDSFLLDEVTFSPTSGFHHAMPNRGSAFCTFSGQVIASVKLYRELGISGAYIDLDGHFGNSIEDTKSFLPEVKQAIPFNINPKGKHAAYIKDTKQTMELVLEEVAKNKIHYIVFCSGADSLVDDDLGGSVSIEEWLHLKEWMYREISRFDKGSKKFPSTISLFGGYRQDHFRSVLDAHLMDLLLCLKIRYGQELPYQSEYRRKGEGSFPLGG